MDTLVIAPAAAPLPEPGLAQLTVLHLPTYQCVHCPAKRSLVRHMRQKKLAHEDRGYVHPVSSYGTSSWVRCTKSLHTRFIHSMSQTHCYYTLSCTACVPMLCGSISSSVLSVFGRGVPRGVSRYAGVRSPWVVSASLRAGNSVGSAERCWSLECAWKIWHSRGDMR